MVVPTKTCVPFHGAALPSQQLEVTLLSYQYVRKVLEYQTLPINKERWKTLTGLIWDPIEAMTDKSTTSHPVQCPYSGDTVQVRT